MMKKGWYVTSPSAAVILAPSDEQGRSLTTPSEEERGQKPRGKEQEQLQKKPQKYGLTEEEAQTAVASGSNDAKQEEGAQWGHRER